MKPLAIYLVLFAASSIGFAQGISGSYISVNGPFQTTKGELDGQRFLYTSQEIFLIPEINMGSGFGLGIGWRGKANAIELHYNRTVHEADFQDSKGEAIMRVWSIDYKYFFMSDGNFQPYLHFGWLPAYSLKIEDASSNISQNPEVRDSRLIASIGTSQLGGGISYVLFSRMNVHAGVTYRFTKYTGVAGGKDIVSARVEEPLKGSGFNAFFSLCYFFKQGE